MSRPQYEKPEDYPCATCKFRAKAEAKPKSFLGRLWRWHTKWCPGWKAYQAAIAKPET